jgi:hypothetical protein
MSKMDTWFRKHDPRNPKDPSKLFAFRDGGPLVVLRPKDAAVKMAMMPKEGTPSAEAAEEFDKALNDHPHQFAGYAGKNGDLLDKWGNKVSELQPGDSLVSGPQFEPPMFMQSGHFHKEVWEGRTVLVLPRPDLKADSNTGIILESPDPKERSGIMMRGGAKEIDCHRPSLNLILTGDPNKEFSAQAGTQ